MLIPSLQTFTKASQYSFSKQQACLASLFYSSARRTLAPRDPKAAKVEGVPCSQITRHSARLSRKLFHTVLWRHTRGQIRNTAHLRKTFISRHLGLPSLLHTTMSALCSYQHYSLESIRCLTFSSVTCIRIDNFSHE